MLKEGTPISLPIEPQRDGQTIYTHFVQTITQLGGVDVIVGARAATIVVATKALHQDILSNQFNRSIRARQS
jgi:hypothetical protein